MTLFCLLGSHKPIDLELVLQFEKNVNIKIFSSEMTLEPVKRRTK